MNNPGWVNLIDRSALLVLHEYNRYANDLVFDTASRLSEQELARPSSPSHVSVQALLYHMMRTEYFFFILCQGQDTETAVNPPAIPSLAQLRDIFAGLEKGRKSYLEDVSEEELDERIPVPFGETGLSLTRWQLIAQSLLHSAHHRGELSIVLTGLGYPLPTLDAIIHFVKESGQHWPW